ncbi:MAG: hypothetical protein R3A10_18240 [Caldilineaceae bacterium]
MAEQTHDLLATVAAMYYLDEMTQNAIADELGLSRQGLPAAQTGA